jgi:flagellar FliJ protein
MAKLHSLIRLNRHNLDERRRVLKELQAQQDMLKQHKQHTLDALAHEKQLAANDLESAKHFPLYLQRVMVQVDALEQAIQQKQLEIHTAAHLLQEAFMDLKKLEVTQERRDQDEINRLNKLESDIMDEIGITGFIRKQQE